MPLLEELSERGLSCRLSLNEAECNAIEAEITDHWREFYKRNDPKIYQRIVSERIGLAEHHQVSTSNRQSEWPKSARILSQSFTEWFVKSDFATSLKNEIGNFIISDEEALGWGNIYFRLVRPNQVNDVGPVHRDEWFWIGNPCHSMQGRRERIKVWIPLISQLGLNGLLVEAYSHLREDLEWSLEERDGIQKPVFNNKLHSLEMTLVDRRPGEAIIFHDRLLHGGMVNKGTSTRVSIEFTCLV